MHFNRLINDFITDDEQNQLKGWFEKVKENHGENNVVTQKNLRELQKSINGWSIMRHFSDTETIRQLTYALVEEEEDDMGEIPQFVWDIRNRIINQWDIPNMDRNSFLQMTMVGRGGFVHPHYDPAPDGYVTCRANVFFSTWDGDSIYIDKELFPIKERDLLCFAASLYKHKTEPCQCDKRIFCSFGFLLPYEVFGINEDHPRARLSQRIWKSFINLKGANYDY